VGVQVPRSPLLILIILSPPGCWRDARRWRA
jgi:hypothetical protein